MLHNYRSRQFHKTSNGEKIRPLGSEMHSAKSDSRSSASSPEGWGLKWLINPWGIMRLIKPRTRSSIHPSNACPLRYSKYFFFNWVTIHFLCDTILRYYASLRNRLKTGSPWVSCEVSSRFCYTTAHSRSMCSIVRVWPQAQQVVGGHLDKIWDFVALLWPIRNPVIATSSALVRGWNFLGDPSVGFKLYISLP